MSTFKKRIAILLSVLMIVSLFAVGTLPASAEEDTLGAGWFIVGDAPMFGASWAPAAEGAMTEEGGLYYVTYTDVPAGTYHFKVVETNSKGSIKQWHPDGMGNDSEVTVEQEGSTVRFMLEPTGNPSADEAYAEVFAPGEEPTPIVPEETEPETEPETEAPPVLPSGSLKVTASSNIVSSVSASYNTKSNHSFTVDFKLKASEKIMNSQGFLTYDSSLLRLDSFTLSGKLHNAVINTDNFNRVTFNTTDLTTPADFKSESVFASAKFTMLNIGSANILFNITELTNVTDDNQFVSLITNGSADKTKVSGKTVLSTPVEPATEKPSTTPKVSITPTKKTVKAGSTFTIKVKNTKKKATYSSSKKTVATVSSKGVVTALKKGTAKITVKVDGKKYTCTVKVSTDPTAKIKKKAVSSKKTYTVKKGKKITVALTGKASSIKNSYSTSKKKIAKVISKTTAKSVVIKGLKKGSATIKIKVNKVKTFTIKVKVK